MGTKKKHLIETVLLSTHTIFYKSWVRKYLQFYSENVIKTCARYSPCLSFFISSSLSSNFSSFTLSIKPSISPIPRRKKPHLYFSCTFEHKIFILLFTNQNLYWCCPKETHYSDLIFLYIKYLKMKSNCKELRALRGFFSHPMRLI